MNINTENIEKSILELAQEIGGEEIVQQNVDENKEENETNVEETLFDAKSYKLDTTLVRVRMKECDLTLRDIEKQIGVAYRTLTRWLSNDDFPQHQNLGKLAKVLKIDPYQLVIRWRGFKIPPPNESDDAIRYIQRRIEIIVAEILEDKETSKEKKLEALTKYHNILLKAKK